MRTNPDVSRLAAWHARLRAGRTRQAAFFASGFAVLFGWLALLNAPHLGANAALHWDAEASITWGPAAGPRSQLTEARAQLYDALAHVRGDDPRRITDYFWSEPGLAFHEPLTRCRYYYSWGSDLIGHAAFAFGRARFGTPLAAVVCYQLTATALTAAGLAAMLAYAVVGAAPGRGLAVRLGMIGLSFAAISSAPVMLSLARQVLQETPGFAFAAFTLLALMAGARRSNASGIVAMLVAGTLAFLTLRCRYTLGPMLGMLLPLAWGLSRDGAQRLRRGFFGGSRCSAKEPAAKRLRSVPWARGVAFALPFAVLVWLDVHRFGPFIWPWVYDEVLVRSSKLFFHADPPYGPFLVAAFINLPLLLIPALGVWCWIDGRDSVACRAYAALVLVVLAVLLWRTAAQQVQFQGRHLFAVADAGVMLWLLVLPRVRWRPASGGLYAAVAAFFLVWNCCSTFGSQRRASLAKLPDAMAVVAQHLGSDGAHDKRSLLRDLWPAYFDWADGRLLHDTLTVWPRVARERDPLLVIDFAAADANQVMLYARMFPGAFQWCMMHGRSDEASVAMARSALAAGRPTFLLTAPGRLPPAGVLAVGPLEPVDVMQVALRRVTGTAAAAVDLDAGAAASATADGITIARGRGTPRRFDAIHGYLPRAQQEWLTYDGDAERVTYDVTGLRPGRSYALGFVTWDPDARGRALGVDVDGATVLPRVTPSTSVAPGDVTVPLAASAGGRARVAFRNVGRADVAVCEVWVCEVARPTTR